ncbi:MAG: hypothetical protein M1825_000280 [Sarcosagium campestre]|nr:MAG: hypothetical protein M1825_000280 [Sarcosagium campestre]
MAYVDIYAEFRSINQCHGESVDPSIANLSLSDPRCNSDSCLEFEAAHNASQAAVSYYWQFEYGHWTTWYYLIVVAIFMLFYAYHLWSDRRPRPEASFMKPSLLDKSLAFARSISYRRFSGRIANTVRLPSAGLQLFILAAIIFATVATFAVRPYYRGHRGYGSPPLAIRTGLMAIALTPIIVALSGKINVVTMLTGIGYEKLNIVHRWLAWICMGLSVAHTIPFIVAPLRDGGAAQLRKQYYKTGGLEYTGTPPLAILFFLSTFSISWVRARVYELFYYTHFLAAIVYLGLMFWHASNLGDSWAYLWATVAIWLFSIVGRIFYKNSAFNIKTPWLEGFPSTVHQLPGDVVKLQVFVPSSYTWRPGQHCFLRLPALSILDNHPFTIASAPTHASSSSATEKPHDEEDANTLSFLIRAHDGFTRKLLNHSASTDEAISPVRTFVDGPYGGLTRKIERAYDSVVLVGGGSGITASVAWLLHLVKHVRADNADDSFAGLKHIKLVWIVRQRVHLQWVEEELTHAKEVAPSGTISFEFYVTDSMHTIPEATLARNAKDIDGRSSSSDSQDVVGPEKPHVGGTTAVTPVIEEPAEQLSLHRLASRVDAEKNIRLGRPDLAQVLPTLLLAPRTCVLGCGPESMKIDLSNAVARAQKRVLNGELREVALYTETFGW